jgi:hypothetical protein
MASWRPTAACSRECFGNMTGFSLAASAAEAVERIALAGSARRHSRLCDYRRCNQRTEPCKHRQLIARSLSCSERPLATTMLCSTLRSFQRLGIVFCVVPLG